MNAGAAGLSTGLIYRPGAFAKTEEIIELAKVASRFGGIYASHMRNEGTRIFDSLSDRERIVAANLDLVANLEGAETTVERYSGCEANGAAELWTIIGGGHSVAFTPTFAEAAWAFLDAHAKP